MRRSSDIVLVPAQLERHSLLQSTPCVAVSNRLSFRVGRKTGNTGTRLRYAIFQLGWKERKR